MPCWILVIFVFLQTFLSFFPRSQWNYLETVWSIWGLLLSFVRWDQTSLLVRSNFFHSCILPSASCFTGFSILAHRNMNYFWPCVSSRDCPSCSFQVVLSSALGSCPTSVHWYSPEGQKAVSLVFSCAVLFSPCNSPLQYWTLQILVILISLDLQLSLLNLGRLLVSAWVLSPCIASSKFSKQKVETGAILVPALFFSIFVITVTYC